MVPSNSYRAFESLAFKTPLPTEMTFFLEIMALDNHIPVTTSLIFCSKSSLTILGLPGLNVCFRNFRVAFGAIIVKIKNDGTAGNVYSFEAKIASCGYHVYKETSWSKTRDGQKVKVELKLENGSRKFGSYASAISVK